jgi:predicted DNA-binding mobile mystery protein A
MNDSKLETVRLLDKQKAPYYRIKPLDPPPDGWITAIRKSLNMTLNQLGSKLGMTAQGARDIEGREASGSITINSLQEVAASLDMKLVYGFVPDEGSFEKMVDARAQILAEEIGKRTSHNMMLAGRAHRGKELRLKAKAMATVLKQEMNRGLWD